MTHNNPSAPGIRVRLQPTWADAWVGVYWKRQKNGHLGAVFTWDGITRENVIEHTVYVCLVPFLPIVVRWYRPWKRTEQ
jgi:hypothetical protein